MKRNRILAYLLIILAITGILFAGELTIVYYNANFAPDSSPSFCVVDETINCDDVARVPESRFLGIPNSLYGILFYLFVLVFAILELFKDKPFVKKYTQTLQNPISYIFCISSAALVVSLFLAFISHYVIHKICILCFVTYFINLLIFFVAKFGINMFEHFKIGFKDLFATLKQPLYLILTSIVVIIGIVFLFVVNKYQFFNPDKSFMYLANQEKYILKYKGDMLGDEHPKVIIHEYTDFQCPFCAMSNSMMIRLVNELDDVAVVHHDFPLDGTCNPKIEKGHGHQNSCLYSCYSLASKKQGKYWDFNSLLFKNNKDLSEKKVLKLAQELGLDVEKLKIDAHNPELNKKLTDEVIIAQKRGIDATPTYRIGMKIHRGLISYPELRQMAISAGAKPKAVK
ncbi:MAG: vitamin K epoxide reductase family protein [Candidatus Gastranaerophilales bacterium]|nr:vitamin K epoxide reductase family protein [Candidatus Gastranaerophilales bacterium]